MFSQIFAPARGRRAGRQRRNRAIRTFAVNDENQATDGGAGTPRGRGAAASARTKISESTVRRLSIYLRFLQDAEGRGSTTISSEELARRGGTTSAQVRKDLSFFGSFGKRGLGYDVGELVTQIREIMGLSHEWSVALVGAGKIGAALFSYRDFQRRGFHIKAVFDSDPAKVGQTWGGLIVRADSEMESVLRAERVDIVVIAVPAEAAQQIVDRVCAAGVQGILNFAPAQLRVREPIALRNVDMAIEMEGLAFALANR
jgi:redox-sensing transcriptional repressor